MGCGQPRAIKLPFLGPETYWKWYPISSGSTRACNGLRSTTLASCTSKYLSISSRALSQLAEENPEALLEAPTSTPVRQLDETNVELGTYHLRYLAGLAMELGFHPGGEYPQSKPYLDLKEGHLVSMPPNHTLYLEPHLAAFFYRAESAPLSMADKRTLLDKLLQFYATHIDNFGTVRSWSILHEVLATPNIGHKPNNP